MSKTLISRCVYTEFINEEIHDERRKLKVFSKDSIYLATKKIDKNNPMENVIRKNNEAVNKWNFYATLATKDMSEEHVKEVKKQVILQPIKESAAEGNGPEMYREIVVIATITLNRLIKEWFNLHIDDRPGARDELFGKMIKYCKEKVIKTKEKCRQRKYKPSEDIFAGLF